ncbi:hypothetical protein, partial [Litoreibacter sp.]|uniref:hypothetical protein n=1 Tax=Roseobacteraceae TaxID=2854170 RepID=UPI00329709D2
MTKDVWASTLEGEASSSLSRFSFWRKKDRNADPAIKAKSIELTKLYHRAAFGLPFDAREIRTRMTWAPWDNKKFKGLLPASFQLFPLLRADVAEIFRRHDLGDA